MEVRPTQSKNLIENTWTAADGTVLILAKKSLKQTYGRIMRTTVVKYEFVNFDRQPKLTISHITPLKGILFPELHVASFPSLLELNLVDTYLPRRLKFTKQTLRNKLRNMGIKLPKTHNSQQLLCSSLRFSPAHDRGCVFESMLPSNGVSVAFLYRKLIELGYLTGDPAKELISHE